LESIAQATRLLERHREELHAIPGVIGTGVGRRQFPPGSEDIVIQIFVVRMEDIAGVVESVSRILNRSDVEVIASGEMAP
jgi:hypothetical protein